MSCKASGDDPRHQRRPVGEDGYCHTCHYARRRHRRTTQRLSAVRRGFGLTAEDLDALRAAQGGRCGGCGRRIGVTKNPCVDHDHNCPFCGGKGCRKCVRGLLCNPCNVYLGYVGDRPEALIRLAMHAVTKPAQAVLTGLDKLGQDGSR